jgi:hypothetical protein
MGDYFAPRFQECLLAARAWFFQSSRLLLLLVVAGSLCLTLSRPVDANPIGRTEDLTPVEFNLGNHKLRIPRAYLWLKPHWYGQSLDGGPETKGVNLEAIVSDMRPYTKDRHELFEGPDRAPKIVRLNIDAGTFDRLRGEAFLRPEVWSKCEKIAELNYFRCDPRAAEPHFDPWWEIFIVESNGINYLIACYKRHIEGDTAKYSHCDSHVRLRPHLFLKVTFERSHLGDAPRVIARARKLVEGFYVGINETPGKEDGSKP